MVIAVRRTAGLGPGAGELYLQGMTDHFSGGGFNRLLVRAINTTLSPTIFPPEPAVMAYPCARKPQERVCTFIFDL